MNTRLRSGLWHSAGRVALGAFLACTFPALALDLLDAPGPGYRDQAAQVRPTSLMTREIPPAVLRAAQQRSNRITIAPARVSSTPLSDQIRRLDQTLPELPVTNPFEKPIRLFGTPAPAANR